MISNIILCILYLEEPPIQVKEWTISPFLTEVRDKSYTWDADINQVEMDEKHVFFTTRDPAIFVFTQDKKTDFIIGSKGQGPGEFGNHRPKAFTLHRSGIWAISLGRLTYFEEGAPILDWKLKHDLPWFAHENLHFAVNSNYLVIPANAQRGFLATVYNWNGEIERTLGQPFASDDDLTYNIAIHDTFWHYHQKRWFCFFPYRPFIHVYDQNFKKVSEWTINGPHLDRLEESFHKREKTENRVTVGNQTFHFPHAHIYDAKFQGDRLFVQTQYTLHEIELAQGKTIARHHFKGLGSPFGEFSGKPLNFNGFALANQRLLLVFPSDHFGTRLWEVKEFPIAGK